MEQMEKTEAEIVNKKSIRALCIWSFVLNVVIIAIIWIVYIIKRKKYEIEKGAKKCQISSTFIYTVNTVY